MENNARFLGAPAFRDFLREPAGSVAIYRLKDSTPRGRQLTRNYVTATACHAGSKVSTTMFAGVDNESMTEVVMFLQVEILVQGKERKKRGRPRKEQS